MNFLTTCSLVFDLICKVIGSSGNKFTKQFSQYPLKFFIALLQRQ